MNYKSLSCFENMLSMQLNFFKMEINQHSEWHTFLSQDLGTVKDWVEGLHRKIDMLVTLTSAVEARLSAVEAAICLVPFNLQDPRSQPPSTG